MLSGSTHAAADSCNPILAVQDNLHCMHIVKMCVLYTLLLVMTSRLISLTEDSQSLKGPLPNLHEGSESAAIVYSPSS